MSRAHPYNDDAARATRAAEIIDRGASRQDKELQLSTWNAFLKQISALSEQEWNQYAFLETKRPKNAPYRTVQQQIFEAYKLSRAMKNDTLKRCFEAIANNHVKQSLKIDIQRHCSGAVEPHLPPPENEQKFWDWMEKPSHYAKAKQRNVRRRHASAQHVTHTQNNPFLVL